MLVPLSSLSQSPAAEQSRFNAAEKHMLIKQPLFTLLNNDMLSFIVWNSKYLISKFPTELNTTRDL